MCGRRGITSCAICALTRISWCSVPKCRATASAWGASSKPASSNPMVKVLTGREDWRCISATMVDESTPPERKAPSGTSASDCRLTASLSVRSSSLRPSASVLMGSRAPASTAPASDHQRRSATLPCIWPGRNGCAGESAGGCPCTVSRQPGSSLKMPW